MSRPIYSIILLIFLVAAPSIETLAIGKQGDRLYFGNLIRYQNLLSSSSKRSSQEWIETAEVFRGIYDDYPTSTKASDALFLSGKMYEEIGERFHYKTDYIKSIELSRLFVERFPNSDLADDAQIRVARITELYSKSDAYREYGKILTDYPGGDMFFAANNKARDLEPYTRLGTEPQSTSGPAHAHLSKPPAPRTPVAAPQRDRVPSHLASITQIRKWSSVDYTRVVIQLDGERAYSSHLLRADPKLKVPPRLYVDIEGATVDPNLNIPTIERGLLQNIKIARNTPQKVRVVLYLNSFENHKVFSLYNPFRIVMDIYGTPSPPGTTVARPLPPVPPKFTLSEGGTSETPSSLMQVLGLKIKTVVIDPGHGGTDPGATGPGGLKEKDVNLKIARALRKKLIQDASIERVVLTRGNDRFLSLEERTAIAQKERADLFVSIHCNSSKNTKAYGIETYILSFTEDPESLAVAARENSTNTRGAGELKDIIEKYVLSSKIDESQSLAKYVQNSMVSELSRNYPKIRNKGVKKAPFVVLIGADVPSILVETSFISNPREAKRLASSRYIDRVATAIMEGIIKYSNNAQTAYLSR